MSRGRRAPKGGYDFAEKGHYRTRLWRALAGAMRDPLIRVPRPHAANVAMLPSKEGLEIAVAKKHGIVEGNIHAIDYNPAIVATLKRKYRHINTYGVSVGAAFERMARSGTTIHVANLDFCGNLSDKLMSEVRAVLLSGALAPESLVAITLLRGRESRSMYDIMMSLVDTAEMGNIAGALVRNYEKLTPADSARLGAIILDLHFGGWGLPAIPYCDIYSSGASTMLWVVLHIIHREHIGEAYLKSRRELARTPTKSWRRRQRLWNRAWRLEPTLWLHEPELATELGTMEEWSDNHWSSVFANHVGAEWRVNMRRAGTGR